MTAGFTIYIESFCLHNLSKLVSLFGVVGEMDGVVSYLQGCFFGDCSAS